MIHAAAQATAGGTSWPEVVTAIGTVGAVVIALFGAAARYWLLRPRLGLALHEHPSVVTREDGSDEAWLHLQVHNGGRRSAAHTEVRVCSIDAVDGTLARAGERPFPRNVDVNLKWAGVPEPSVRTSAGATRLSDLLVVKAALDRHLHPQPDGGAMMVVVKALSDTTDVRPASRNRLRIPGSYELDLEVSSDDVPARRSTLRLVSRIESAEVVVEATLSPRGGGPSSSCTYRLADWQRAGTTTAPGAGADRG